MPQPQQVSSTEGGLTRSEENADGASASREIFPALSTSANETNPFAVSFAPVESSFIPQLEHGCPRIDWNSAPRTCEPLAGLAPPAPCIKLAPATTANIRGLKLTPTQGEEDRGIGNGTERAHGRGFSRGFGVGERIEGPIELSPESGGRNPSSDFESAEEIGKAMFAKMQEEVCDAFK